MRTNLFSALVAGVFLAAPFGARAGVYEDILAAVQNNQTETVVSLLGRGLDVNTTDRNGTTLLMFAAANGNEQLLEFLLRHRANVRKINRFGDSALAMAALNGHLGAVKRLLDAGADFPAKRWNALHYAAFAGRTEVAGLLARRGAPLDERAPNGQTALMLAAKAGHLDVVRVLIEADADMDLNDYDGHSAVELAIKAGHPAVVKYLRDEGAVE